MSNFRTGQTVYYSDADGNWHKGTYVDQRYVSVSGQLPVVRAEIIVNDIRVLARYDSLSSVRPRRVFIA